MTELRSKTSADDDFCYMLHELTMREYVTATYGRWDETEQREFHRRWFASQDIRIVEGQGVPIGVLQVEQSEDRAYLGRIELLPEWQGRGIGSALVRELTARGPVELHVMASNPRASALYERLGFVPVVEKTNARILMRHDGPT